MRILLGPDRSRLTRVIENLTQPFGQLFLRLLLMVVIPLVFSALGSESRPSATFAGLDGSV